MSQITAASIFETLSGFDSFVRTAVHDGHIDKVQGKEEEMVSRTSAFFKYIKTCRVYSEIVL